MKAEVREDDIVLFMILLEDIRRHIRRLLGETSDRIFPAAAR